MAVAVAEPTDLSAVLVQLLEPTAVLEAAALLITPAELEFRVKETTEQLAELTSAVVAVVAALAPKAFDVKAVVVVASVANLTLLVQTHITPVAVAMAPIVPED